MRNYRDFIDPTFRLETRSHLQNGFFGDAPDIYIKREDELSSGVCGSKLRKYASIVPYLKAERFDEVLVIGSEQANNVVAAAQLFNEAGLPYRVLVKEQHKAGDLRGNALRLRMLTPENRIILSEKPLAEAVEDLRLQDRGKRFYVLNEGADVPEALPGLLTLADDVLRNERELGLRFSRIYADAGTGATAAGLLLGLGLRGQRKPIECVVTLLAGSEATFARQVATYANYYEKVFGLRPEAGLPYRCLLPVTCKSFGAVNATVKQAVIDIARTEGLLTEPIYSGKHFLTVRSDLQHNPPDGAVLVIHNGGAPAASGFEGAFAALVGSEKS